MNSQLGNKYLGLKITNLEVKDVRFPTSEAVDRPSDAVHGTSIDFSAPYVILTVQNENGDKISKGFGFAFTLGRGNDLICQAVQSHAHLVIGHSLGTIYSDFSSFWRHLVHEQQLRWLGPEKGVTHMAVGAILNALWDLWAKLEGKPLWTLLADMTPEELSSTIPFEHITNALTREEALTILKENETTKDKRRSYLLKNGLPAYVTSVGWIGYDDREIVKRCKEALLDGWRNFKMKVGINLKDDVRRAKIIRETIGNDCRLMLDANQKWEVSEAIEWMKSLAHFQPTWIEEPTSPDDVIGHEQIAHELRALKIGVATGEHCCNRIIFKQLLQRNAIGFCQIDACRLASVNEVLAVLLMAAKFKVPVCPHAGGVGLCELVPHLSAINYIAIAPTLDNVMVEYVDHLHEHFIHPAEVRRGCYVLPTVPGYNTEMHSSSVADYEYPTGTFWREKLSTSDKK